LAQSLGQADEGVNAANCAPVTAPDESAVRLVLAWLTLEGVLGGGCLSCHRKPLHQERCYVTKARRPCATHAATTRLSNTGGFTRKPSVMAGPDCGERIRKALSVWKQSKISQKSAVSQVFSFRFT